MIDLMRSNAPMTRRILAFRRKREAAAQAADLARRMARMEDDHDFDLWMFDWMAKGKMPDHPYRGEAARQRAR